jgi:hypothetical protein
MFTDELPFRSVFIGVPSVAKRAFQKSMFIGDDLWLIMLPFRAPGRGSGRKQP